MKYAVSSAALVAGVVSQATFEPADFNVTEALLNNGVKVSALPELAPLAERSSLDGCSIACNSLKLIFGDDQVETQSEAAYDAFIGDYWAGQQRDISPQCVFKPEKALDVSTSILLSRLTQCPFAAKSGGHSAVPGGSNIEGGITISFEKMNKTTASSDKKSATFEPGQTCQHALNQSSGISYFSSVYGLACDNVISYELVTASGLIINVSKDSFPDLYWALRGGGNNFGIVTKFNVNAIPRAPTMWGGMRAYYGNQSETLIKAYYNLGMNGKNDGKAHQILSFGYGAEVGEIAQVELEYSDPITDAPVLAEYNSIKGAISDKAGINSLANLTANLAAPGAAARQAFWTWTTKLDLEMATLAKDTFYEELDSILDVPGLLGAVSLQVLTDPIIEKSATNGGNALGLDPKDGPLMLALVSMSWANSGDDDKMNKFHARIKDRCVAAAKAKGKANEYLYMNYASPWQDPVAGYGPANKARLQAISKKYDPTGVFEILQPGYFKLNGPPRNDL
ncbi:uncharacterized protein J4E92_008208 [Alternaria infectoria]|uniref:uncharacterized protein n=1 Tax=Alternaria infectoria TaxID=45303 RepID=UPI0022209A16|nr:uncharacterized protein J4E92_008208 [Alternaria infectoria]KAI4921219.1 hypothetical protein J4E92_008208 [Alternaria infectoria]